MVICEAVPDAHGADEIEAFGQNGGFEEVKGPDVAVDKGVTGVEEVDGLRVANVVLSVLFSLYVMYVMTRAR